MPRQRTRLDPKRATTRLMIPVVAVLAFAGCDKIGPMREHNPENKVNSPSDPHHIPPPGDGPIIDPSTGRPLANVRVRKAVETDPPRRRGRRQFEVHLRRGSALPRGNQSSHFPRTSSHFLARVKLLILPYSCENARKTRKY
jgi:hypothetical protein